jgi:hypothetical protein
MGTQFFRMEDATQQRGIKVYDTALPQSWYDAVYQRLRVNPSGHVVWCYDEPYGMIGIPRAVDAEGDVILGALAGSIG